jgi:acyl-CoA synthetase (AMP-forming)/AMP-acid ligase II
MWSYVILVIAKRHGIDAASVCLQRCLYRGFGRMRLETMARYKRPRAYVSVDSLPKNNYSKVLKTTLRQHCAPAEALPH